MRHVLTTALPIVYYRIYKVLGDYFIVLADFYMYERGGNIAITLLASSACGASVH